ncbi:hypothetical protein Hanom_Chr09g00795941 [Helianthus anomalus]
MVNRFIAYRNRARNSKFAFGDCYTCVCIMCCLCMFNYVMCGNQSNRNRNVIELNQNRIMIISGEKTAQDMNSCD